MNFVKYLFALLLLISGCKTDENPVTPQVDSDAQISEFFNYSVGNTASYSFTVVDKANTVIASGERISEIKEQRDLSNNNYLVFEHKINSTSSNNVTETFIRYNLSTLEQYIDTTGSYSVVPDSMRSSLSLDFSPESSLFKYPLLNNQSWTVFETEILVGTYKIKVIDISANYLGKEQVDLGSTFGLVDAEKIDYDIELNFPDMSNPFIPNKQNYKAEIWFSKDLGIVKISGTKFFTNFLIGRQINMGDTLFVENQILK